MPIYRYRCPQGHESERLRPFDVSETSCPCGQTAERQAVYRMSMIGNTEIPRDERNYRQSFSEYQDALHDVVHKYERAYDNHDPVREPDYYALAKTQAIAKGAPIR